MSYYVRKIARAKWSVLNKGDENIIYNYRADTIANDLHVTENNLSLWKVDTLESDDINPIIIINSLLNKKNSINKIDLLCVPEELVSKYSLSSHAIDTVLTQQDDRHYDIVNLSVRLLMDFATEVVIDILTKADQPANPSIPTLVKTVKKEEQIKLIVDWLDAGKLSFDELGEKQKDEVDKYKNKKNN